MGHRRPAKHPPPHRESSAAAGDGGVRGGDETGGWFRGRHLDGKETLYAGVSLGEVLRAAGVRFDPGMAGLRETVSAAVLVEGADGYRVVFALAEWTRPSTKGG